MDVKTARKYARAKMLHCSMKTPHVPSNQKCLRRGSASIKMRVTSNSTNDVQGNFYSIQSRMLNAKVLVRL